MKRTTTGNRFIPVFTLLLLSPFCNAQLGAGIYTVGTIGGEDYTSLTEPGGIFEAINSVGLSGDIVVEITSDLNENGTVALNEWASSNSITIVPQTASIKQITHTGACANDFIRLNGADRVTIDGRFAMSGNDRFLHFASNCPDQSVIELSDDCLNTTIRNCIISSDNALSSQSNGGAIHVNLNQINGSDSLRIMYNLIRDYTGVVDLFDGIQVNAPDNAGAVLNGLEITHNEFDNINAKAIYLIERTGEINASLLAANHIYATGTITGPGVGWTYSPIQLESGSGHLIRANYIGGQGTFCSGGKMNTVLAPGTQTIAIIRMKDLLPNAAMNYIDSNVIRNISAAGSTVNRLSFSAIRIESGNCEIGTNDGNIFGDLTSDASTPGSASIYMTENFNSTSNAMHFIYASTTGTVLAENNSTGSIHMAANNSDGIRCYLFYSDGTSASFNNNVIGGVSNSIYKEANNDMRIFYSTGDNLPFTISGNVAFGITATAGFNGNFYGIRVIAGVGLPSIVNNHFENIDINGITTTYMIRTENPGALIEANEVRNVSIYSSDAGSQFYGIYVDINGSNIVIKDNALREIELLNPGIQTNLMGIYTTGNSFYIIDANFLEKFKITSLDNNSYFRGIYINSSGQNTVFNNVVLMDNLGWTNDIYIYSIYDNTSGSSDIFHNTVDIRGAGSGSRRTACFYLNNSGTRNVQNNIFTNSRYGGSSGNYSMYYNSTSNPLTCQFNLLYAEENPSKVVRYGGNLTFVGWQATGNGLNSVNPLSSQILVDFTTGKQVTSVGNDIANPIGILEDHLNVVRPQGLGFDMGAFEVLSDSLLSPLPIVLGEFDMQCEENRNRIEWTTIGELNSAFFTLEESKDGLEWEVIRKVPGAGNAQTTHHYSILDTIARRQTVYYRLSQTDFDGATTLIGTKSAACTEDACGEYVISITGNRLNCSFNQGCIDSEVELVVYDYSGRIVYQANELENIVLPIQQTSGIYVVTITSKGRVYQQKCAVTP